MTAAGMPRPIPIFAPVERPDGFEEIEVGNAEALASTSASELCHQIGTPSPTADVPLVKVVVIGTL
jgi:hypothetical protein